MDRERDERPWGTYEVLEDASSHKVTRIEVRPGQPLSYQRHQRRAEHWFVVSGLAQVTIDGADHVLSAGMASDIPVGAAHRVANGGGGAARLHRGAARGLLRRGRHRATGG